MSYSRVFLLRDECGITVQYALRFMKSDTPDGALLYYDNTRGEYLAGLPADYDSNRSNYVLYRCADDISLVSLFDYASLMAGLSGGNVPCQDEILYIKRARMSEAEYEDFARKYPTIPLADLDADAKEAAQYE